MEAKMASYTLPTTPPTPSKTLPIEETVSGAGWVSCNVTGGCVNIKINSVDQGNYGAGQATSNPFTKEHKSTDPEWKVNVTRVSGFISLTFNSP